MYAVVVNEGPASADDNTILFTKTEPTYMSVPIEVEGKPETFDRVVFVVFVPTNGPSKGKQIRVPFDRIVYIKQS